MIIALRSTALLGLIAFAGCAADSTSPVSTAGQVKRILDCRPKAGVDQTAVLRAANYFAKVPGVLDVSAGLTPLASGNSGETITFVITFQNASARDRADSQTAFLNIRNKQLAALCESVASRDITLQNYLVSEQFTEETTTATRERRAAAMKQQDEMRSRTR